MRKRLLVLTVAAVAILVIAPGIAQGSEAEYPVFR